ncbi:MAG TPA: zf-HC2 domain-containing protein [Ktedonobacterales bacterium]
MTTPDAPSQPLCSLGVTTRTLSALRDDALSQVEAARLATHIETCAACQARLAAFDDLAILLRAERAPQPDARLWRAVSTAADTSSPARRPRFPGGAFTRLSWRSIATVAAALLLIVGFVALLTLRRPTSPTQPTSTVTPQPTATSQPTATLQPTATPFPLLPAHPLTWSATQAPSAGGQPIIFAGDGQSAYTCEVDAVLRVWRTYNRGASWVAARQVPNDPSMNMCELVVDATDPSVAALAWSPRGGGAGDPFTGLMTTVDGGATWQTAPSQPFSQIDQLDSRGGVIYALRETVNSSNSVVYHIWASSNRMRSWRQVDHGLPSDVTGFWLQPGGSSILVVVSDPTATTSQLWLSPDDGVTWSQLTVPGGAPSYRPARFISLTSSQNGIVARWLNGRFTICVSNATLATTGPGSAPTVTCSTDSGATWHARPLLLLASAVGAVGVNLIAIADDGAALASGLGDLYRLSAASDRWQSLGPLPPGAQPGASYCPSPGAGVLWTLWIPIASGSQGRIFVANYAP